MQVNNVTAKEATLRFFDAATSGNIDPLPELKQSQEILNSQQQTTYLIGSGSKKHLEASEPLDAKINAVFGAFRPQDYSKEELIKLKNSIEHEHLGATEKIPIRMRLVALFSKSTRGQLKETKLANRKILTELNTANWAEKKGSMLSQIHRQLIKLEDPDKELAVKNRVLAFGPTQLGHPLRLAFMKNKSSGEPLADFRENLNALPPPTFKGFNNPTDLPNMKYGVELQRLGESLVKTQKEMTLSQKQAHAIRLLESLSRLIPEDKMTKTALEGVYEDFAQVNIKTPDFIYEIMTTPLPAEESIQAEALNHLINPLLSSSLYR